MKIIKYTSLSFVIFLLAIFVSYSTAVSSAPITPKDIPEVLKPWKAWVLHGMEDLSCPFSYSNVNSRFCAWPTRLKLNLKEDSGLFEQAWDVYKRSWVRLPGSHLHWPHDVTVNNKRAVVLDKDGFPMIELPPGEASIKGRFSWKTLPESLSIDTSTGLVELSINGRNVRSPHIDTNQRLWLSKIQTTDAKPTDKTENLAVNVYRRLLDDVPFTVVTYIELNVSGDQREALLSKALLDKSIPTMLNSQLPARLELNGDLRMQVRPGRWVVEITSRFVDAISGLKLAQSRPPWPQQEVWVFDPRSYLRSVEIEGVDPIDPRQTTMPEHWKRLPTYLMTKEKTFVMKVTRRGNTEPEPNQLELRRMIWLDFNGEGYTIKDEITGIMKSGWRLDASHELALGKVVVNGQPQVITTLPGSEIQGVEVRQGQVDIVADARYEHPEDNIPVVGWMENFQRVDTTLNLPPGWTLFDVDGVDNVPDTWIHNWTLLDLFLVLILSMAVFRLWNWFWGLIALATFTLIWQEPIDTPRYIWINIFVAIALLRVVPRNTFHKFIMAYRNLSLLALLVITVPFMVEEVRTGIYPQLERPWQNFNADVSQSFVELDEPKTEIAAEEESAMAPSRKIKAMIAPRSAPVRDEKKAMDRLSLLVDPNATLLTGPGLPDWKWNQVILTWSGPSDQQQRLNLTLVSPTTNMLMNFVRVGLLLLLCMLVFGVSFSFKGSAKSTEKSEKPRKMPYLMVFLLLLAGVSSTKADVPTQKMLDDLKERLLESPECLPACADSSRMSINLVNDVLTLDIELHARHNVAVPLPSQTDQWYPDSILVNNKGASGLSRAKDGVLWIALDQGIHRIRMRGRVPDRSYFQLPLLLTPKSVEVNTNGWTVDGIKENGVPDRQIQFSRIQKQLRNKKLSNLETGPLPAFVRVERTLKLGLEWFVETTVYRVSATGAPIIFELPLIPGESVLSDNVSVKDRNVLVNFSSQQSHLSWRSSLDKQDSITLVAGQTSDWVEVWRLDVSPVWHADFEGIAFVHQQNKRVSWVPEWHPYPGESITINVTRPEGVTGKTITIERSNLEIVPGNRATDSTIRFTLRSSQGTQHTITLPVDAVLESVEINDVAQPIRLEGRRVTLPVNPGLQTYKIKWRMPVGVSSYYISQNVDLGLDSVNHNIQMQIPTDRWVLLTAGPRLGPAVLFWGVVLVILVLAVILGISRLTPLRFWHWFLLGVGLSQVHIVFAMIVVGWLLALGVRQVIIEAKGNLVFDLIQVGYALLTILATAVLFYAIQQGLLGSPDMQISGNGSTAYQLNWYQDHAEESLPSVWVLSVPILAYRLLMLVWALWLAYSLLGWLRWAWQQYSEGGYWRKLRSKIKRSEKKSTGRTPDETVSPSEG